MRLLNFFTKKPDLKAVLEKKTEIQQALRNIYTVLKENNHAGQAEVIQGLTDALSENDVDKFLSKFYTVDMWGGSGAVWEVGFDNYQADQKFMRAFVSLISVLEQVNITSGKIKTIKKYFVKEIDY